MNKIRIWKAIARGVLLESIRRKDLWVVAILGFIIILAAGALGFFGIKGLEIFAKDLALTVVGMFSTILSILTAARLLPEEIRNRTLYPLLSRPISRFDLLMGKLLGAVVASWIGFMCLAALTAIALATFHVQFEWVMLQYVVVKMLGLVMLCTVTLALSAYMTPQAAATMSFVLAFGTSIIVRALVMANYSAAPATKVAFQLINGLLPQYGLFDMSTRAVYQSWGPAPEWVVGALVAYMLVYCSGTMLLAWTKFRRQAI